MGWLIALVMCSILPFMGVGAAFMGKAVQEIQNESQSWYAKASAVVEECLNLRSPIYPTFPFLGFL